MAWVENRSQRSPRRVFENWLKEQQGVNRLDRHGTCWNHCFPTRLTQVDAVYRFSAEKVWALQALVRLSNESTFQA